jgi:hypothetical protein
MQYCEVLKYEEAWLHMLMTYQLSPCQQDIDISEIVIKLKKTWSLNNRKNYTLGISRVPCDDTLYYFIFIYNSYHQLITMQTVGYAALEVGGKLVPWEFQRRPVGDNDVLIEILYAGICHSDIHQVDNDWNSSTYPMVPGHEIVSDVIPIRLYCRNHGNSVAGDEHRLQQSCHGFSNTILTPTVHEDYIIDNKCLMSYTYILIEHRLARSHRLDLR